MAFYMNAVAVFVMVMGSLVSCQKELEIDKDENIEPFAIHCRIYNVAKNPPINHVDLQDAFKIVVEIDALNTSSVESNFLNETEHVENSAKVQLTSTITREAAVAQLRLNQITQRAHKILDEIREVNIASEIEKVKAEFYKAIFGENGNESQLEQTALNGIGGRAQACGDTGLATKGYHAGKNLVVDFFCLCVQRTDEEGVNQVCGFYVGVKNSKIGWNEIGHLGSSTMWASIKGGCGKHMHQHPKSTAEARHILDQFLKHLKTGGVYRWGKKDNKNILGSGRKEGMLGTGVGTENGQGNDILCDGKKGGKSGNPGGLCVYYGPNDWKANIAWLKQFNAALASADIANNQTATIQHFLQKLQMLLHRAEEIYETTKVITEIQNPVGLTVPQNESANLTAFNTTRKLSYSHSPHPYLVPLLVLLLR